MCCLSLTLFASCVAEQTDSPSTQSPLHYAFLTTNDESYLIDTLTIPFSSSHNILGEGFVLSEGTTLIIPAAGTYQVSYQISMLVYDLFSYEDTALSFALTRNGIAPAQEIAGSRWGFDLNTLGSTMTNIPFDTASVSVICQFEAGDTLNVVLRNGNKSLASQLKGTNQYLTTVNLSVVEVASVEVPYAYGYASASSAPLSGTTPVSFDATSVSSDGAFTFLPGPEGILVNEPGLYLASYQISTTYKPGLEHRFYWAVNGNSVTSPTFPSYWGVEAQTAPTDLLFQDNLSVDFLFAAQAQDRLTLQAEWIGALGPTAGWCPSSLGETGAAVQVVKIDLNNNLPGSAPSCAFLHSKETQTLVAGQEHDIKFTDFIGSNDLVFEDRSAILFLSGGTYRASWQVNAYGYDTYTEAGYPDPKSLEFHLALNGSETPLPGSSWGLDLQAYPTQLSQNNQLSPCVIFTVAPGDTLKLRVKAGNWIQNQAEIRPADSGVVSASLSLYKLR